MDLMLFVNHLLYEINQKLKIDIRGFRIMGMPYKCPPAPFEASLLVDSMLRKRGIRDSVQIDFYSPAKVSFSKVLTNN